MTDQPLATVQTSRKRQLGPRNALDVPKRRRISPLIIEALELLASGQARTQKDAAEMVNCSPEHLCKQLAKDHVKDYLTRAARTKVRGAVLRAAYVKVGLLECESANVRNDVASDILAMEGIAPPTKGHGANISVNVQAGYIINLSGEQQAPIIDAKAEVIEG